MMTLADLDLCPLDKLADISGISDAAILGFTMQTEEQDQHLMGKQELLEKISVLAGGRAAEELVFNEITTGAANDIAQATKLARAMVSRYGMSEEFGMVAMERVDNPYLGGDSSLTCSEATSKSIDRQVIELVQRQQNAAKEILKKNIQKLHDLAKYLFEEETINGDKFMKMVQASE